MLIERMLIDKGKKNLLTLLCVLCAWRCHVPVMAANSYSPGASALVTAVRFLRLAEKYCDAGDYQKAQETADMGIGYRDDVSDLWYVKAHCAAEEGRTRAEVLQLVEKALNGGGTWVDYNMEKARVLYADVLCDVGRGPQALAVLDGDDGSPHIYGADAQFIRAKAYYRGRTAGDTQKARALVDDSRKMYPADERFALLFFRYERALRAESEAADGESVGDEGTGVGDSGSGEVNENGGADSGVKKIADAFIARLDSYKNMTSELFLTAAMMAGDEKRQEMLRSFAAKGSSTEGMRHPLYALLALQDGILDAKNAVEYFFWDADDSISMQDMRAFLNCAAQYDDARDAVATHLSAYSGLVAADTTGDAEPNLFIKYDSGKVAAINYDENSDGVNEWVAKCTDGVPVSLELGGYGGRLKTEVGYGIYPSITSVTLVTGKIVSFSLVEDTYLWSPFKMDSVAKWREDFGVDVVVPQALEAIPPLDMDSLVNAAWRCQMPVGERANAAVTYTMLNGQRQTSEYASNGKVYARGIYVNGLPVLRMVDGDGDGVFETTERYSRVNSDDSRKKDEAQGRGDTSLLAAASGGALFAEDVYVSRVEVDMDEDTVPDFVEEYTADGGRISTWDNDGDGQWDVRYTRYTRYEVAGDGGDGKHKQIAVGEARRTMVEKSYFFVPPSRQAVCVESVDGVPASVTVGEKQTPINKGDALYWIGEAGESGLEESVRGMLQEVPQGIRVLSSVEDKRIFAVRVGDNCYAYIVNEVKEDETK